MTAVSTKKDPTWLELTTDDTLALVCQFCDVESALALERAHPDLVSDRTPRLWKNLFHRMGFAHEDVSGDYLQDLKKRLMLSKTFLSPSPQKAGPFRPSGFQLPNRHFFFHPILPLEHAGAHSVDWTDPPPVDFDCDSFILSSTALAPELIMLDPFSGSLSVYHNVLDNATRSDEGMVEEAMRQTTHAIVNQDLQDSGHLIMQHTIDQLLERNFRIEDYLTAPKQVLLDATDYFNIDLAEYLLRTPENDLQEFEVGYVGVEAKPTLDENFQVTGNMIAIGRTIASDDTSNSERVVELIAWFRNGSQTKFHQQSVCRFHGAFNAVDISANHGYAFVNYSGINNGSPAHRFGCNEIHAYPFEPYQPLDKSQPVTRRYFPNPKFTLRCSNQCIVAFATSAEGSYVVASALNANLQSHIHIWDVSRIDNITSLTMSIRKKFEEVFEKRNNPPPVNCAPITGIFVPKTLSIRDAGFVTLQRSRNDGLSIVYYRKEADDWNIKSIIRLPLTSDRLPRIHFDGRRLIVFGQDHIGLIILIYHVQFGNDNSEEFATTKVNEEASGGVLNVGERASIRFANRVRHAALGELPPFDALFMTCNERFIIVNTKSGNLLADSGGFTDGLLVIDLDDHFSAEHQATH